MSNPPMDENEQLAWAIAMQWSPDGNPNAENEAWNQVLQMSDQTRAKSILDRASEIFDEEFPEQPPPNTNLTTETVDPTKYSRENNR